MSIASHTYYDEILGGLPQPVRAIDVAVPGIVQLGHVIVSGVVPNIDSWSTAVASGSVFPVEILKAAGATLAEATADVAPDATVIFVVVGTGVGAALLMGGLIAGRVVGQESSVTFRIALRVKSFHLMESGPVAPLLRKPAGDAVYAK